MQEDLRDRFGRSLALLPPDLAGLVLAQPLEQIQQRAALADEGHREALRAVTRFQAAFGHERRQFPLQLLYVHPSPHRALRAGRNHPPKGVAAPANGRAAPGFRLLAAGNLNLAPAPEQWEIEAEPMPAAECPSIARELRGVALALPVEERVGVRAFVAARLVVH